MSKTVATTVIIGSVNHVPDEDVDELLEKYDADSLSEVTESMEGTVESIMARQFSDADDIPILDVSTDVYDEWNEGKVEEQLDA